MSRIPFTGRLPKIIWFADNEEARFGTDADYRLYFDGTDLKIQGDTGTIDTDRPIVFNTGVAVTAGDYSIGRDADATNQLHLNVPDSATIELSVNDVAELVLSSTIVNVKGNLLRWDSTGTAITAANYELGRNADATNVLQFNVPNTASTKFTLSDVQAILINTKGVTFGTGNTTNGMIHGPIGEASTTDATVTALVTLTLADENTYYVEAWCVGVQSTGAKRAGYKVACTVYRTAAGVATLQGTATAIHTGESTAGWDATLAVSGNNVLLQVTGEAATTIKWAGALTYANVTTV